MRSIFSLGCCDRFRKRLKRSKKYFRKPLSGVFFWMKRFSLLRNPAQRPLQTGPRFRRPTQNKTTLERRTRGFRWCDQCRFSESCPRSGCVLTCLKCDVILIGKHRLRSSVRNLCRSFQTLGLPELRSFLIFEKWWQPVFLGRKLYVWNWFLSGKGIRPHLIPRHNITLLNTTGNTSALNSIPWDGRLRRSSLDLHLNHGLTTAKSNSEYCSPW